MNRRPPGPLALGLESLAKKKTHSKKLTVKPHPDPVVALQWSNMERLVSSFGSSSRCSSSGSGGQLHHPQLLWHLP
ncbi:40S ribosomal protein S4-3 [Zea mays]|uniref:40S ribosomal protein S4-3 n=1 Tax=Zea mays TaxID=4577 RepID=A0A1D6N1U6_MAIZE|nr:40S ribosomal protein S4-3 [Zea mays]